MGDGMLTVRKSGGKLLLSLVVDGQTKVLQRAPDEAVRKTLRRLELAIMSKRDQKAAKKRAAPADFVVAIDATNGAHSPSVTSRDGDEDELSPDTALYEDDGRRVPLDVPNGVAWTQGRILSFAGRSLRVQVDPPVISSLSVITRPLAGIPIYPVVATESVDLALSKFEWFRRTGPDLVRGKIDLSTGRTSTPPPAEEALDPPRWEPCGHERVYRPTQEDVGRRLALRCTPASNRMAWFGTPVMAVTASPVEPFPASVPFVRRQEQHVGSAYAPAPKRLRVVSYNILADALATTEYALKTLFPYCAPRFMDVDYRKQLIATELIGYRADVVCLQEVGPREHAYLAHVLGLNGYAGDFTAKKGSNTDGCSLFYRTERLEPVLDLTMIEMGARASDPRYEPLLDVILGSNRSLRRIAHTRTTVLQLAAFRDKARAGTGADTVVVANTHLYFHPEADAVRAVQLAMVACEAAKFRDEAFGQGAPVGLVLTGDLNSRTASMAMRLLKDGRTDVDWVADVLRLRAARNTPFQSIVSSNNTGEAAKSKPATGTEGDANGEESETAISDTALQAEAAELAGRVAVLRDIGSAAGISLPPRFVLASGTPPFTNYVPSFAEALDHVLVDEGGPLVSCDNAAPIPSLEEITAETALPSSVFPSDHIAVVCEVEWADDRR